MLRFEAKNSLLRLERTEVLETLGEGGREGGREEHKIYRENNIVLLYTEYVYLQFIRITSKCGLRLHAVPLRCVTMDSTIRSVLPRFRLVYR